MVNQHNKLIITLFADNYIEHPLSLYSVYFEAHFEFCLPKGCILEGGGGRGGMEGVAK